MARPGGGDGPYRNVSAPRGRLGDKLDAAGRLTAAAAVELSVELGWPRPQAPSPRRAAGTPSPRAAHRG